MRSPRSAATADRVIGHRERHRVERVAWLRAAVLGANDGVVSTASLLVGVLSSGADRHAVMIAGVAALIAGAMSMAAGEYVSVSSQADAEDAELQQERRELRHDPAHELTELADIYAGRGVEPDLARQVAAQLMDHDALGAHARDELGISTTMAAKPVQAALASAAAFASGALAPLAAAYLAPSGIASLTVFSVSLIALVALGWLGARAGGAGARRGIARVLFWGALAMLATWLVGRAFGTAAA